MLDFESVFHVPDTLLREPWWRSLGADESGFFLVFQAAFPNGVAAAIFVHTATRCNWDLNAGDLGGGECENLELAFEQVMRAVQKVGGEVSNAA